MKKVWKTSRAWCGRRSLGYLGRLLRRQEFSASEWLAGLLRPLPYFPPIGVPLPSILTQWGFCCPAWGSQPSQRAAVAATSKPASRSTAVSRARARFYGPCGARWGRTAARVASCARSLSLPARLHLRKRGESGDGEEGRRLEGSGAGRVSDGSR